MTEKDDGGLLIRAGAPAVARWRIENPGHSIVADNVAASDLELSGINLAGADLRGSAFLRCDLKHASFVAARLDGARFVDCVLDGADFSKANLVGTTFDNVDLDGAVFNACATLGRLKVLRLRKRASTHPVYDREMLPWIDKWVGWDRLRFLGTIRIFVPAYASLTLSVLYLNGIAWINSALTASNALLERAFGGDYFVPLARLIPNWTHALVVMSFVLLSLSATAFLACPARVIEFSRERWVSELGEPELLYDYAIWQRWALRCFCAVALILGGTLGGLLLVRAIVIQISFVFHHLG